MSLQLAHRPTDQTPLAVACRSDKAVQDAEKALTTAKPRPTPAHYAALKSALDAVWKGYRFEHFGEPSEQHETDGPTPNWN